jgi:hypothetical protein
LAEKNHQSHDEAPTHVLAQPGDRRSLCGAKDPLPRVAAAFVSMHINGWGMKVCPGCAQALLEMPERAEHA